MNASHKLWIVTSKAKLWKRCFPPFKMPFSEGQAGRSTCCAIFGFVMWLNWASRVLQRSVWVLAIFFKQELFFWKVSRKIIFQHWYFADFSIFILRDKGNWDFSINLAKTWVKRSLVFRFLGCFPLFVFSVIMMLYLCGTPCWRPAFNAVDGFESLQTTE